MRAPVTSCTHGRFRDRPPRHPEVWSLGPRRGQYATKLAGAHEVWRVIAAQANPRNPEPPTPAGATGPTRNPYEISAGICTRSATTSPSSRSTLPGSTSPAPKCWVDCAPQATP
jgi:hypothetical protein